MSRALQLLRRRHLAANRGKDLLRLPLAYILERSARWSQRKAGVVLVYHRLAERAGNPDTELVPAMASRLFTAQMQHLAARYRTVPASEILDAARARRRGERFPVAVTFDDDSASHVTQALPILRRLGIPATFFLCGASLQHPFTFWWESLQRVFDRSGGDSLRSLPLGRHVDDSVPSIHEMGRLIEAMAPHQRRDVETALNDALGTGDVRPGLRADDVRALASARFEIGFHTLHHDPLPPLDDVALEEALAHGRSQLASVVGREIAVIAYPHGRGDPRVAAAAERAGYRLGFTCSGSTVDPESHPFLLGRVFPSPISRRHFAFQLARLVRTPQSAT